MFSLNLETIERLLETEKRLGSKKDRNPFPKKIPDKEIVLLIPNGFMA
jgi:hypothetical protein